MKLHVFLRRNLRVVQFYPALRPLLGSASAVLFFGQALYWSDKTDNGSRWFWKTEEQWEEETSLSRREQETARRLLRQVGVLQEEFRGIPRKLWFRLDLERFEELAENYFSEEKPSNNSIMHENAIIACTDPPLLYGGKRQASMAESAITTPSKRRTGAAPRPLILQQETTAEITAADPAAVPSRAPHHHSLPPEIHTAIAALPPAYQADALQVSSEEPGDPAQKLAALRLFVTALAGGKAKSAGYLRQAIRQGWTMPEGGKLEQQALAADEAEAWAWWQGLTGAKQARLELENHSKLLGARLTGRRKALILFRSVKELQEAA